MVVPPPRGPERIESSTRFARRQLGFVENGTRGGGIFGGLRAAFLAGIGLPLCGACSAELLLFHPVAAGEGGSPALP